MSSIHADTLWLWSPKDVESPPALLWTDHMGEVVQAHETPMGACLLPPQTAYLEPPSEKSSPEKKRRKRKGARVDRWSKKRYKAAELKMVEIMHGWGAEVRNPIPRQELRDGVRKHIGDTGLLDHLLKHMAGKVVADGAERLRRRHNSEGAMEYWLEPVDLAEVRRKAGVTDPYWVPPPGWSVGDRALFCPFGGVECKEEAHRLREEVAALKRDYQSLIQWKSKMEEEMEEEVVQGREASLGGRLLCPLSAGLTGWGVRRKVKYTRRHRDVPLSPGVVEAACEQLIGRTRSRQHKKMEKVKDEKEEEDKRRRGKEKGDQVSDSRVDRWPLARYEAAEVKLVEIMHRLGAKLWSPIMRLPLREETRKHIGDTGLLDHLLKHMCGKVVGDGTERLQRRHNADGAMEYWLEPSDLAEIRKMAGVRDPYWVPPPGWKLGDATTPCPCGAKCEKEMNLREEVATLKRQVERLNEQMKLEKQAKEALFEAGGLPELAEMEEQVGRRYDWCAQFLAGSEESWNQGSDSIDER